MKRATILMVVNAEWYFWSHRLALARGLQARGYTVIVAAGVERGMGSQIEAEGFRFIPLPLVRGRLSLGAEIRALVALVRLYRQEQPDLLYHTTIKPILYGSLSAQFLGIARRVNAIPGLGYVFAPTSLSGRFRQQLVAIAYRIALSGSRARVIFQNSDDQQLFVKRRIAPSRRTVVIRSSGVDLCRFSPTTEPTPISAPIILLASRLLWDKGVGELVEATKRLKRMNMACRTVIVGIPDHDNPRAVPVAALEGWQRDGLIEWWGLRDDMPNVIRQSAVVVLPSYYPEGVPRILLEAAASARPVVTTDTPGCRDCVRNGESGLLVPPRDVDALTDALKLLLEDPGLRALMGLEGRKLVEEQFDEENVVSQTVKICEDLLAEAPSRPVL